MSCVDAAARSTCSEQEFGMSHFGTWTRRSIPRRFADTIDSVNLCVGAEQARSSPSV